MYLSRVHFTPQGVRSQCRSGRVASLFREHQMIWNLFDNNADQQRDFLYRREDQPGQPPFYYLLSARKPLVQDDRMVIETKVFSPQLAAGDRLQFQLRANAVITRKAEDNSKRRIRRDIIEARVDHYKAMYSEPADWPQPSVIHQEAVEAWLQGQGERHGFSMQDLLVSNHRFHKVNKPGDQNRRQFTSIDLTGQLRVKEPDHFVEQMCKGFGRSKAFGCGLMLVRRA